MIYNLVVWFRNQCYNRGVFRQFEASVPTVCLGNLSMGGTGKTPHTKFILKHFNKNVVVLSRGYGRKSKGFFWVETNSSANQVGDEPLEIKLSNPGVSVAVCEKRVEGVQRILNELPNTELIVLDDAYQHRKLKCSYYILLTTFQQPFFKDFAFPQGYLRDTKSEARRAKAIIVSKTPKGNLEDYNSTLNKFSPAPIYYSGLKYSETLTSLDGTTINITDLQTQNFILITGIAKADLFKKHWKEKGTVLKHLAFSDHYNYKQNDINQIRQIFDSFADQNPVVMTTEKDRMRLKQFVNDNSLKNLPIYSSQIEVIMANEQDFIIKIQTHISTFKHERKHIR